MSQDVFGKPTEMRDDCIDGKLSFGKLYVAFVDKTRCRVIVGSRDEDFQLRIERLNTEDARRLALRQASKEGWRDITLKDHTVIFGGGKHFDEELDNETPYLVVDIYTPASSEFTHFGDSLG